MTRQRILLIATGLIFILVTNIQTGFSAPAASYNAVNHDTKQCVMGFFPGDEFGWCNLPKGWERLSPDNAPCPSGYTVVEKLKGECKKTGWNMVTQKHENEGFSCSP